MHTSVALCTNSLRWVPREEVTASHSASPLLTPGSEALPDWETYPGSYYKLRQGAKSDFPTGVALLGTLFLIFPGFLEGLSPGCPGFGFLTL